MTGSRVSGDALVKSTITAIAGPDVALSNRLELYRALDKQISAQADVQLPGRSRRAVLLVDLEGFTNAEAGEIVNAPATEAAPADAGSYQKPPGPPQSKVFIIEDEPLVAAHVAEIVRGMGHTVLGTAATARAARAACRSHPPDLILSDMVLGEDSTGGEVATEIAAELQIPVIFMTAYPQNLLKGQQGEPAYLVTKPFRADTVRTVVEQALLQHRHQRAS